MNPRLAAGRAPTKYNAIADYLAERQRQCESIAVISWAGMVSVRREGKRKQHAVTIKARGWRVPARLHPHVPARPGRSGRDPKRLRKLPRGRCVP